MLQALEIVLFVVGFLSAAFFIWAAIISKNENETFAYRKFINLGLLIISVSFLIVITHNILLISLLLIILLASIIVGFILLLPYEKKNNYTHSIPLQRIDERDTMFSRRELQKGSEEYKKYYKDKKDREASDNDFRSLPGLLSPNSTQYHRFHFASAEAGFQTVDAFYNEVDNKVEAEVENKTEVEDEKISRYIKNWAKKLGAIDCGITVLKDYHVYSYGGRR